MNSTVHEGLAGEHGLTAEHTAPRLIAAWDGTDGLEPPRTTGGSRDLRGLAAALNAPLLAAGLDRKDWQGARAVYHLAIAAADEDRLLSDDEWADIAAEYVDRLGLAPRGDEEAVRWIAQSGGFLARTGDGEPGVQTLWRGWQRRWHTAFCGRAEASVRRPSVMYWRSRWP